MITFLRLVGALNAAVWLGSVVFFTLVVWPAFDSEIMLSLLGSGGHAQLAGLIVMERFFTVTLACSLIAVFQLGVEWLYTGKPVNKPNLYVLVATLALCLLGWMVLQPNMTEEHAVRTSKSRTLEERQEAHRSYQILFGVTQATTLLLIAGVGFYSWRIIQPPAQPRFTSSRFRS